ncbi:MAG: UDP-3-O-(3-hydroxymyristoyl)glucosamine N-acyltransferase [Bacteroidia bacterium]
MILQNKITIRELAEMVDAQVFGDEQALVSGINEIHKVAEGDLTFVDAEKYYNKVLNSKATFILINKKVECPEGKVLVFHSSPFEAYNLIVEHFYKVENAFDLENEISDEASIQKSAIIHPNVVIGNNVTIGKNTIIYPNVTIYDNVQIGDNVIVHSGSVIGGQAYYYAKKDGKYTKWHSCGSVHIDDDVEIGSCCTIDKGVSGITRIGEGTKLDNQVHVAHGVVIGKNCLFAAQCGIGGKTIVEDDVICWGQVGITKSIRIGKGAVISAQSGVSKSLVGGKAYFGSPAREIKTIQKEMAALRKLPEYFNNNL